MSDNPLETIIELDPNLAEAMNGARELAFQDGVLDIKTKLLISLAIDATKGTPEGVRVFAERAIKAGATKEEIAEVARIIYLINGVSAMYPVSIGLEGLV
jgi:alkylhydroperoxidase/carboxymuconolactone decarboxylase family protein YurZ